MAWDIEMVKIVRGLIGDVDETNPMYSNTRLQDMILVSGQLTQSMANFAQSYTIDVDELVLSPDPTVTPRDDGFINLVCLKTACIILNSEWRTASNSAMSIKDGPSSIDGKGIAAAKGEVAKEACGNFEDAMKQYRAGNSKAGEAIVGPHRYAGNDYNHHVRIPLTRQTFN
jgi:hypothetical protein